MRIDRYWKQATAGLLAIVTPIMTEGNLDSLTMTNSQPLEVQGQMLPSPDKIVIGDEGDNAQSFQAAAASQPVIQTKTQIAAFEEVITPKTDTTSLFGAGRLTIMANHDTAAQLLLVIIETGEGGPIVMDGGWINNADYFLNQIKQKGGYIQAWLLIHPDSDHVGASVDILYKHNGEIIINSICYSFAEDSWYTKKDPEVARMVTCIKGAFGLVPQSVLHGDIVSGQVIQVGPVRIQVLNQAYKMNSDFTNNSNVAYTVPLSGINTVFLGNLARSGDEQLMADHDLSTPKCDIVQVAHHGQNSVDYEVYKALGPSVVLWPTPQWLRDSDNGDSSGSDIWFTQETENWMVHLEVSANYRIKDGDQVTEQNVK